VREKCGEKIGKGGDCGKVKCYPFTISIADNLINIQREG
jgi:hypothetical protein